MIAKGVMVGADAGQRRLPVRMALFTSRFPYPSGEQFLEHELPVLASRFSEVLIVPLQGLHGGVARTSLPSNVSCFRLGTSEQERRRSPRFSKFGGVTGFAAIRGGALGLRAIWEQRSVGPRAVTRVFRKLLHAVGLAVEIAEGLPGDGPEILYSYWANEVALVPALLLRLLKNRRSIHAGGPIFVSRAHRYDLYANVSRLPRLPFQRFVLCQCDLMAPCSRQGARYLKEEYPVQSAKIRHQHLGVAVQRFGSGKSADGVLRLLTCSYSVAVKRLHLLIEALHLTGRRIHWTHIGDGPEQKALLAQASLVPEHVTCSFLGELSNEQVLLYYRDNPIDCFINVSESEGIPVSIMEALSFGVQVIATRVGGVEELVQAEFGTLLDPAFHPRTLAKLLEGFTPSEDAKKAACAFQRERFSTLNYERFCDIIAEMVSERDLEVPFSPRCV